MQRRARSQNSGRKMKTLIPEWTEYELVDSGGGKKLERLGELTLIRPELQAKWAATLPMKHWQGAGGEFVKARTGEHGDWKFRKPIPARWMMQRKNLKFWVQPAPSGHVGVFSGPSVSLGLHRGSNEGCPQAAEGPVPLRAYGPGDAGSSRCRRGIDARGRFTESGGVRARKPESLRAERPPHRWIVEDAITFVKREARHGSR